MQPTKLSDVTQQIIDQMTALAADIDSELATHPSGYAEIMAAHTRRDALKQRHKVLQGLSAVFSMALNALHLPSVDTMVWAQSLLDLPNAAILEIDTTSLEYEAEVIRVLLLSMSGDVLFDRVMRGPTVTETPSFDDSNQHHTGITPETLAQAQPIVEAWPDVMATLQGRYLVSYGMDFDSGHIKRQHTRLNGAPYRLFTEDLQSQVGGYFGSGYYTKLEDCAQQIGQPMPDKPERNALDRAKATLAVLRAMADGWQKPAIETASGEEFPF